MRIYVGQTRSAELVRRLWLLGIGECAQPYELPPRRRPWFFDNGAYGQFAAAMKAAYGKGWRKLNGANPLMYPAIPTGINAASFARGLDAIYRCIDRPEFIVLPDIVAGGLASMEESRRWVHRCRGLAPLYLAIQDGMEPADVDDKLAGACAGYFIGGTLKWKIRHGEKWTRAAHERGLRCHIGRMGTPKRIRWGMRINADSIDSALPLWAETNLQRFLGALEPAAQPELFTEAA